MRTAGGIGVRTLILLLGTALILLVLTGSAGAASLVKNEPSRTQTTFSVPNESGEKGSGCPLGPLVEVDQFGGYHEPHSCPWSVTIRHGGEVVWERSYSGEGKLEHAIGKSGFEGNTEASLGVVSYPWSCERTGRMKWTTEVMDDQGSGWVERRSGWLIIPRCIPIHRVFETLPRAQEAIIGKLASEYVSRLQCSRRYFVWHCKVAYNNTFRECDATFRVTFYWGVDFGEVVKGKEVTRRRRRCTYFR